MVGLALGEVFRRKGQFEAAQESLTSVSDALNRPDAALNILAQMVPCAFQLGAESTIEFTPKPTDLFLLECDAVRANGAVTFEICCKPTELYHEIVTAVAMHWNAEIVVRHGWPILSLESGQPSVTEAGEAAILPGGGFSA